ncbi:MAG: hypothetical protein A2W25_11700 [candidate division Zixibacteria bacterium RBG_16_53_22]|nr:MAG: hypothetical protein A2W25_11700 [candidate division Zixibacteria bacterium RBG_16_53_22]
MKIAIFYNTFSGEHTVDSAHIETVSQEWLKILRRAIQVGYFTFQLDGRYRIVPWHQVICIEVEET